MGTDAQLPPGLPAAEGARLDGWKEIAVYLNRHVATVRRWEKTEALPVHRHLHDKLGSVYAFRPELDAWWQSRRVRLAAPGTGELPLEPGAPDELKDDEPPGAVSVPAALSASGAAPGGPAPVTSTHAGRRPDETGEARVSGAALARFRWAALAGALAVALLTASYAVSRGGEVPRREIRSLAVLPLDNLSGDPAQDYFADGMTDALITSVAQIQGLRVISRTSVMRFKGSQKPLPEIARELGVDAIVGGAVQRSGARVKITMQLVDGASDHHIWAREYDRHLADVLKLQGEVARAVAEEIRVTGEEGARLISAQPIDPAAHEAYLLGRYHAWKMNDDDLKLAIGHFERAIQIDPQYAAAHADLSLAWQYRSVFAAMPFRDSEAPARSAALVALALDQRLAASRLASGHFKFVYDLDFEGAETDLRRAIDLDPNSVDAHYYYAKLLQCLGRFPEALHHMERARELDPLSSSVASFFGKTLYNAGRYEEAVPHLKRAIELEPRNTLAHTRLTETYEEIGRYDEALAYHQRVYERTDGVGHLIRIARLQARTGKRKEARRTLQQVNASARAEAGQVLHARVPGGLAVEFAAAHAALGDNDEAVRWLMRAIDARDSFRPFFLKVDPPFATLRADPRWGEVLGRLNLSK